MHAWRKRPGCLASMLLAGAVASAQAGSVTVPALPGGDVACRVASLQELRFRSTIRQRYDFSCGSAALATLLSYHYRSPVTEEAVFREMYAAGDPVRIRKEGFSLLDMKRYLERAGYLADGYRMSLDDLARIGVPAIALVDRGGYRHFVVIKGIAAREVAVGDPAAGGQVVPRASFEKGWNGLLFLIHGGRGAAGGFNRPADWRVRERAPLGALPGGDLANVTFLYGGKAGP